MREQGEETREEEEGWWNGEGGGHRALREREKENEKGAHLRIRKICVGCSGREASRGCRDWTMLLYVANKKILKVSTVTSLLCYHSMTIAHPQEY